MIGFRILFICFVLAILVPQNAHAQAVPKPLEIDAPNDEYMRAIRLQRVQADVRYFDPASPAPDFVTNEQPKQVSERRTASGGAEIDLPIAIIAALILAGVIFLFLRFGGSGALVMRSDVKNPKRDTSAAGRVRNATPTDGRSFESLLNNPDRQQALIGLAQLLIYRAVSANDLLLQRSWTARDVLRRMPKNSKYLPELSALILKGELVHFGERAVSEEEFAEYAARAKPLLQELSA